MKKILIMYLLLIPSAFTAAEALSVNLDAALKTAEENSPLLMKAELSLKSALRTHETSWNTFLPQLGLSGTLNGSDSLIPENRNTSSPWNIYGGINIYLHLSPAAAFSLEADRLSYELELLNYQRIRITLFADVEKAYYALLTQKSDLVIKESNLRLAQERWEQSKTNFSEGIGSELSVLQSEVFAANLIPVYNQAIQDHEISKRNFLMLIGLAPETLISLEGKLPEYLSEIRLNTTSFLKKSIPGRVDIRTMKIRKSIFENAKNYISSGRAPSLGLSAGYSNSLSNILGAEEANFTDSISMSLTLSIPFDGWIPGSRTDTIIKNYDDSIEQTEVSIEQLTSSAETEIINLVSKIQSLQETIELSRIGLNLAKRSYKLTEESFSRGQTERIVIEDAQYALRKAEQQLLSFRSDLVYSLIDLRLALNIESTEYFLNIN